MFKIKFEPDSVPGEASLLELKTASFLQCFHMAFPLSVHGEREGKRERERERALWCLFLEAH